MKRKNWGRVLSIGLAGALWVSSAVWAAPTYNEQTDSSAVEHPNHAYDFAYGATKYVIDTQNRGVLHIHKTTDSLEDMGDVTYTLYQVAAIEQGQLDDTGSVSMEYRSLIRDSTEQGTVIDIPSGLSSTQELQNWINGLLDGEEPAMRMGNREELPSWSAVTDRNGNATFDGDGAGLPLGLYIVYESSYSNRVTEVRPFVVSLPMAAVDEWVYDVQVYPKNAVAPLSLEKHIVADRGEADSGLPEGMDDPSNDVLTDTEDFSMGERIRYWLRADVPVTIGELEVYYLLDRMSVGQTFINDVAEGNAAARMEVWGRTVQGEMVYIPRMSEGVENYRVVSAKEMENITNVQDFTDFYGNDMSIRAEQPEAYAHENAFAVLFNTQSLSEDAAGDGTTKRVPLYSEVYVTYDLVLNEKALVGQPGNVNDVALVLSHRTTDNRWEIENEVHVPENVFEAFKEPGKQDLDVIDPQCIDTRVYTYALQVTKEGEGNENMAGVTFQLCDSRGIVIKVSRYTEEDLESLKVDGCSARVGDYYVDPAAQEGAEIVIDDDQQVYIYGLGDGTYQLVETKTLSGYQLLKAPVVLTIASEAADKMQPMSYCTDPEGAYFQIQSGKGYYIWQDKMKVRIDVSGHEEGSFVAVKGEVYSYDAKGDDGSMSRNEALVKTRYSYRYTDCESMVYWSNYGMEGADDRQIADGIFNSERGMYEDGLFAFTVLNRHGFNVPAAGGGGQTLYAIIGSGAAGCGIAGMIRYCKRRKELHAA